MSNLHGIHTDLTPTDFDFDSLSAMTIPSARAALYKMERPVVRWTQYQDLGHGEFRFTSDQLQRVLRPLNKKYDYLAMWQFGKEAYLQVRPLRQFIRSCKPMTELRGSFCMSGDRFALVIDELDGDQARHFYPCWQQNIRAVYLCLQRGQVGDVHSSRMAAVHDSHRSGNDNRIASPNLYTTPGDIISKE